MIDKAHLEDTIKNYLQTETNFALLIAGKWGSGKTFFYENSIVPLAKGLKLPNTPLNFLPVRISLFGINSIEELESEIIASLYPFFKNSTLKVGAGLLKAVTKGVVKNKLGIDLEEYLPKDFSVDKSSVITKEHLLLCFDDLERKGDKLSAGQVIGYINSMVENNGSKVIILTNEDKIGGDDFKAFKEKTIGISILFEQDIDKIYDDFILSKFSNGNAPYYKFLLDNKMELLIIMRNADSNLRIIIDCLKRFEEVFNYIEKQNFVNGKEIVENAARFLIGLNIEFKLGLLPADTIKELNKAVLGIHELNWNPAASLRLMDADDRKEPSYIDIFKAKYFLNVSDFKYYQTLFNYVIYYNSLNESEFHGELVNLFPMPQKEASYIYDFKIISNDFGDLSEVDYLDTLQRVVEHAAQGRYGFADTLYVFYYAMRFENPKEYNKDTLVDLLIDGLSISYTSHRYDGTLHYSLEISGSHPYYQEMTKIAAAALRLNGQKLAEINKYDSDIFKDLFDNDVLQFFEAIKSSENYHKNVFSSFDAQLFLDKLLSDFTYRQIELFTSFVKGKYDGLNIDNYSVDYEFLGKVLDVADIVPEGDVSFMKKTVFTKLIQVLKNISRLKEINNPEL